MATITGPTILYRIYGRTGGYTKDGYEVSMTNHINAPTTAAADLILTQGGISALSSATATYSLPAPNTYGIGLTKRILTNTTSTNVRTITCSNCNFNTTGGSSFITITLQDGGQYLNLLAQSSGLWLVTGTNSSAVFTT